MTFLELSGTSSVTTHKFAAPESSKLYSTVRKPSESLGTMPQDPSEILLTMLILSTVVFNLLWRFPSRKRSMNQGQKRKEDTGRRTHSCMEKHTLHAILRHCGTGGDWRGLELLCPLCILPLTPPGTSSLVLLKDKAVKSCLPLRLIHFSAQQK